jgi:hypothetical protein
MAERLPARSGKLNARFNLSVLRKLQVSGLERSAFAEAAATVGMLTIANDTTANRVLEKNGDSNRNRSRIYALLVPVNGLAAFVAILAAGVALYPCRAI